MDKKKADEDKYISELKNIQKNYKNTVDNVLQYKY